MVCDIAAPLGPLGRVGGHMTDIDSSDDARIAERSVPQAPERIAGPGRPRERRAIRRRMQFQAWLLLSVAILVLVTAMSVPFVLHYLQIKIP